MNKWVGHTERQDSEGAEDVKTEEDWENFKTEEEWKVWFDASKVPVSEKQRPKKLEKMKEDYLKYGSPYGKKYAVTTNYGEWDSKFTLEKMESFIKHFYRVLRPGGACIVFFDLWKLTNLKDIMERSGPLTKRAVPRTPMKGKGGEEDEKPEDFLARKKEVEKNPFKQFGLTKLRFIEWIKTNPQPINSSASYLTNCREIALMGVKGKCSSTFNSKYDNATYRYPLQGGKERFHPTQKSLPLFEDLINKHSNEGDLVLDCFAGSATTAVAALKTNRRFVGCELDEEYYKEALARVESNRKQRYDDLMKELELVQRRIKSLDID